MRQTFEFSDFLNNELEELKASEVKTIPVLIQESIDDLVNESVLIETGFPELNKQIGGLGKGDLNILAGRPASGKTSLALQMSVSAAQQTRTIFFSAEMTSLTIAHKFIAMATGISVKELRKKEFYNREKDEVVAILEKLKQNIDSNLYPLTVCDTSITVQQIERDINILRNIYGDLGMIVVDYLQYIGNENQFSSEQNWLKVGDNARILKNVSHSFDISVLALSQLKRPSGLKAVVAPTMADLSESGKIEQDASVIMLLWRDEANTGLTNLLVGKDRYGAEEGSEPLTLEYKNSKFFEKKICNADVLWPSN